MIDGLSTGELALVLAAILAVVAGWTLYVRHRRPVRAPVDPAASPPDGTVPVDSPLVERLYASRDWSAIRPLLTDDFALVGPHGTRAGLDAFRRTNEQMASAYEDLHATVELIVADLEHPSVLYVRDHSRGRARKKGPDLDVTAWTRVVVASDGTHIRELGPSTVVG